MNLTVGTGKSRKEAEEGMKNEMPAGNPVKRKKNVQYERQRTRKTEKNRGKRTQTEKAIKDEREKNTGFSLNERTRGLPQRGPKRTNPRPPGSQILIPLWGA